MSFVTATALSEDKTRHYFSSANEVIFLFHVLFGATVSETSLDFFGMQRTVFLRLSVFSFFLELALRGRFSLIVLFQAFFVYFEPVSDAFCLIRSFPTKKSAANNKKLFRGGGSIPVSVFPFS